MITDVFFRRYDDVPLFPSYGERERRFLGQAAQIITDDLFPRNKVRYKEEADDPGSRAQEVAHRKLARELGVDWLINPRFNHPWKAPNGNTVSQSFARSSADKTRLYLTQAIGEHSSSELFVKFRVSLVELCFQEQERQLVERRAHVAHALSSAGDAIKLYNALQPAGTSWQSREKAAVEAQQLTFNAAVHELNERFRQARIPLRYHNALIQVSDDNLIEEHVERPFWALVAAPKWAVVDQQIKEAVDERDRGERNPISNALNALESTIKIISTEHGWNSGNEKGAANYVDNLVKERAGGRFIEVWEKEALVTLFRDIRNLFNHGPSGDQPLPTLTPQQVDWAINSSMVWIRSLVQRA